MLQNTFQDKSGIWKLISTVPELMLKILDLTESDGLLIFKRI